MAELSVEDFLSGGKTSGNDLVALHPIRFMFCGVDRLTHFLECRDARHAKVITVIDHGEKVELANHFYQSGLAGAIRLNSTTDGRE